MANKKEIKLTETRRSLPISLLRTRELIMEEIRPILNSHDITEQQWRVLRVVKERGEAVDASAIADQSCLLAPSLTRILRTLSERGFIETVKDTNDLRRVMVKLTDEGSAFIDAVAPESVEVFKNLRKIVGEERWESLIELLTEIRDDINQARNA